MSLNYDSQIILNNASTTKCMVSPLEIVENLAVSQAPSHLSRKIFQQSSRQERGNGKQSRLLHIIDVMIKEE